METINIQLQVPNTGKYSMDEFIAKIKEYANSLTVSIKKPKQSYTDICMSKEEQEAYVAESLNRALDEMEEHRKNGTKPMTFDEFLNTLD